MEEKTMALYLAKVFPRYKLIHIKVCPVLCKALGIQQNISTAYHPRTDGQSECTNQWLEHYLQFWVNEQQDN